MLSIFNTVHKFWEEENTVSVNYYELFVDSTDDLPDDVYCFSTDSMRYKIMQGSIAYVISEGNIYSINSEGEWILQSSGGGSGFTPTDAQLIAMNSGITSEYVTQIGTNTNNILAIQQTIGDINSVLEGVL